MGLLGMIGKALLSDALYVREENSQRRILRESIKNNRGSNTLEKFNASLVNLSDATDITKRIGHALSDLSVDEGKKSLRRGIISLPCVLHTVIMVFMMAMATFMNIRME